MTLTKDGRRPDGLPISGGMTFETVTGRQTTPFPKQKSEKYASKWLKHNATTEAKIRCDISAEAQFTFAKLRKGGFLTDADRESMTDYLFVWKGKIDEQE
jgi:hypothetical protein